MTSTRKALLLTMGLVLGAVGVLIVDAVSEAAKEPVLLRFVCRPGRVALFKGKADVKRFWRYAKSGQPYRLISERQSRRLILLQGRLGGGHRELLCDLIEDRRLKRYIIYQEGEPQDKTEFRRNLVESNLPLPELRLLKRDLLGRTDIHAPKLNLAQLYNLLDGVLIFPEKKVMPGEEWSGQGARGVVLLKWRWRLLSLKTTELGKEAEIEGTVEFLRHPARIGRADINYTFLVDSGLIRRLRSHFLVICPSGLDRFSLEYEETLTLELAESVEIEPEAASKQMAHVEQFLSALRTGNGEEVVRQLTMAATSSPPENPLLPVYHRLLNAAKEALERDRIKKLLEELREGVPHHEHHEDKHNQHERR